MASTGIGALADDEEEEIFSYDYGEDFPEALIEYAKAVLGGRPTNSTLGPLQQIKILAVGAEFRAPTARRPGKGKMLPASDFEREMEIDARKNAQKHTQRLILPKPKGESSDAFLRRLDAHRVAQESLILPLAPAEDEILFAKRMVAVKAIEQPNVLILPKTSRESLHEFDERLDACKKAGSPIVFQRGAYESGAQFKVRLGAQAKCKRPIMPKSSEEPEKGFAERCKIQALCEKVVHPYDPKREDEHSYFRRLAANREKTALGFAPGDARAIADAIGVEREKKPLPAAAPAADATAADLMRQAEAETERELAEQAAAEEAEQAKLREAEEAKKAEEEEAERVAQRIADMKLKAAEAQAAAEAEATRQKSFDFEQINISSIGFMPLKKLLMDRGVPKEEVFGAPSKFALQEVAKKWGDELKIQWVSE